MSEISEFFPVTAGLVIGLVVLRIASPRIRAIALIALSVLAGVLASFISGELFISWDFIFFDIPLVFAAAAAVVLGVSWWRRRSAATR
ncbi:MAG TPA: hypothetical protein PLO33_18210 [Kouleothrix sp.]|uniref:hypothetical protein n=1 Tax=Kouleothrix sp. TaxID=2779161 RepID=UPI002B8522A5|nr:hypothetical protein [Kouleothrix sp.]HRC77624.1 hypothetical protein [Kouleothrix sp.]